VTWRFSRSQILSGESLNPNEIFLPDENLGPNSMKWPELALARIGDCSLFEHLHKPLGHLLNSPSQLGIVLRRTFPSQIPIHPTQTPSQNSGPPTFGPENVHIIFVTTERLGSVRLLLKSIRKFWGWGIQVSCVVQRPPNNAWIRLGKRFDFEILFVQRDLGLAASRNLLVEKNSADLIFLMDDDFQIDERANLDVCLDIMAKRPEIQVLGGNLLDVTRGSAPRKEEISQGFAMRMKKRFPEVVWLRLENSVRKRIFTDEIYYIEECDIVDNFAIFRKDYFGSAEVFWNPRLKIGAEHQDLYIRASDKGIGGIYRTNALRVRNVRVQDRKFRHLRQRTNHFFRIFFQDLDLKGFEILGERRRVVTSDGGTILYESAGRSLKFFGDRI
jgi:hypothetical protein